MRKVLAACLVVPLLGAFAAHAAPRTARAYYVGTLTAVEAIVPTALCTGGEQPARVGGACFSVDEADTKVTITIIDYTGEAPDGVYFFYDGGMQRIGTGSPKLCDKSVDVTVPAGAEHLVVIPAAHVYKLNVNTCRYHGDTEVLGVAGTIRVTFA